MHTRVLPLGPNPETWKESLIEASSVLKSGGLVVFPTETVYGLGALALEEKSVQKIYTAKGRPSTNPLIVHVASLAKAQELTDDWTEVADRLAKKFWPGPLTLIVRKKIIVPDIVTGGGPTVALRMPAHPIARALLEEVGQPIAGPSANLSNTLSATTAGHVLKGLDGKVDIILDAGPTPGGLESTVVDCTSEPVVLLRPGLITQKQIEEAGVTVTTVRPVSTTNHAFRSPGMLTRHYAPRVKMSVVSASELSAAMTDRTGVLLCGDEITSVWPHSERLPANPQEYSAGLYAALHRLEELDIDRILVQNPPPGDEWLAVHDRLMRAAAE